MDYAIKDKISESKEELELEIKSLEKYEKLELKDLVVNAEIVFLEEHICNDNLKKRGLDEGFFEPEEIIEENDKSKVTLKELEKVNQND